MLHGELDVHQADDMQRLRQFAGGRMDFRQNLFRQITRRNGAGRIAGMDARLLDVLHDRADDRLAAVRKAVDVQFLRVAEEFVDENRMAFGDARRLRHIGAQRNFLIDNRHRTAAQHERRTDEHGITDFRRDAACVLRVRRHAAGGLPDADLLRDFLEDAAVVRRVDVRRRRADDSDAGVLQFARQIQRRLAAELHDDTVALLAFVDIQHVFKRQRLEIEAIRRIIVC